MDKSVVSAVGHFGSRTTADPLIMMFFLLLRGQLCFRHMSRALSMTSISELREFYAVPRELWASFVQVAGDPGEDMKLLAALPYTVIAASLERAITATGQPLTAVQASHVGLVYNLARRIIYTKGGGDWDKWQDQSPFLDQRQAHGNEGPNVQLVKADTPGERKLKMTQVIDKSDDGEFVVQSEEVRAKWYGHPKKRTQRQNKSVPWTSASTRRTFLHF